MTHDELREWLEAVQVARRETGDYEFFNVWADELMYAAFGS